MVNGIEEIDRAGCRQVFEDRFTAARMTTEYIRLYRQVVSEETLPFKSEFSGYTKVKLKLEPDLEKGAKL